jgi:hypothetical protein
MSPIALSTWCVRDDESPAGFVARAQDLGAASIALDARRDPDWLAELLADDVGGLPVVAIEAPCPRPRRARLPRLASEDRDERRAAQGLVADAIALAGRVGARLVITAIGRLDVRVDRARLERRFGEGRRAAADAGEELATRVRLQARGLDLARQGLDPLLGRAADAGVTLAVPNRPTWWELPDDADLGILLEDFRGAPLAPWHDPAAAHAREALGWGRHADALAAWRERFAGAWLSDASGLLLGLPWGRGEVDRAAVHAALPAAALRIVHAAPGALDTELAAALAAVTSS